MITRVIEKMKIKNNKFIFVFIILIFIGISCQKNEIYHQFQEIKDGTWNKYDTLFFEIDSLETGIPYTISLEVTNNINYPYQNIWIFAQDNLSDSTFSDSQKEYLLADKFGKWIGSGFGSLYQSSLPYRANIILNDKRNHLIKIEHGMRDESLIGIEKVGIKISRSE